MCLFPHLLYWLPLLLPPASERSLLAPSPHDSLRKGMYASRPRHVSQDEPEATSEQRNTAFQTLKSYMDKPMTTLTMRQEQQLRSALAKLLPGRNDRSMRLVPWYFWEYRKNDALYILFEAQE